MATFLQYMLSSDKSPAATPQIVVVSGENAVLSRVAVDELLDNLAVGPDAVTRFFGDEHPARTVLVASGKQPIFRNEKGEYRNEAIIYDQIEKVEGGVTLLTKFLDAPTPGVWLILVAYENSGKGSNRWIPSNDRVLYIDCSKVDTDKLVSYAKLQGLVQEDAEWLVEQCGGDAPEVFRNLDILQVFPRELVKEGKREVRKPYQPGLVSHIFGRLGEDVIRFDKFAILDNGSDLSLCVQLRKRIEQIIVLSTHAGHHLTALELMNRAEIDGWLFKRVMGLAKSAPPRVWLEKLVIVAEAESYVRQGQKGVREYLAPLL